jgi:hypothetical protein|tara:strand:- start:15 stop:332 length:318 start_codon:yes stop_codon:yes gene_type:complete
MLTDTPTAAAKATTVAAAPKTLPVLSNIPFAGIITPYSMYSLAFGVPEVLSARRIAIGELVVLQTLIVNEATIDEGTVYTVVSVAAASDAVPNFPVAMIYPPAVK